MIKIVFSLTLLKDGLETYFYRFFSINRGKNMKIFKKIGL